MCVCQFLCKHQKKLFWITVALGTLFLAWKAQYGYIFNDEPFIVSLGHRLAQGDKLFVDEWNTTQLFSFFVFPLVKLYTAIAGSTQGLLLFIRLVYVVFWVLVSCVLYFRFQKYGAISLFLMLYFLLFTPLDMMSVTYNAMALACFALFTSYFLTQGNRVKDVLNGVVLALGVLASPYAVVLYVVYAAAVITVRFTPLQKRELAKAKIFDLRTLLLVTAGAAAVAALFSGYLLWIGVDRVIGYFDHALVNSAASAVKLLSTGKALLQACPIQIFVGIPVLLVSLFDKKRYDRKLIYFALQTAVWCASVFFVMLKLRTLLNVIMMPMTLLGLQAFALTRKKDINAFCALWVMGVLFAACSNASSDTGVLVIAMALTISGLGSILHIHDLAREFDFNAPKVKQWVTFGFALIICVQLGSQTVTRVARTYWDDLLPGLDTRITQGVASGIVTTQERAEKYEAIREDIQIIRSMADPEDRVLTPSLLPWIYLELDLRYGTYSSWTYISNQKNHASFLARLNEYYQEDPDRMPQYIYVENDDLVCLDALDRVVDLTRYERIEGRCGLILKEIVPQ